MRSHAKVDDVDFYLKVVYSKTSVSKYSNSKFFNKELTMVTVKKVDELFHGSILTNAGNDVLGILLIARHRSQALYLLQPMGITEAMMEDFITRVIGRLETLRARAEGCG